MVDIHSEYRNFVPPEWVYPTVQRLLALETTIGSAGRTGEPAAEAWQRRLWRQHLQQRYWYFRPLKFLFRWLRQFARFMAARQRARGGTESSNPKILKS